MTPRGSGRVSWSWWSDHTSSTNPAALKDSIDLAADLGWEHTLIDANWDLIPEADFDDILAHARDRGVGVFLWYNSGGANNLVPEQPRDRMHEPAVRQAEFARLAELEIAGVKVDFFHSDRTDIIERYHAIASDAADAGLMVNFHGCTAPKGWERTWPNVLTMEAVHGAEQYFFAEDYPETAVWHNTVLPFTRNVVGSMDYTPVTFSDQRYPRLTTAGHELALAVVFQSRLQHFADSAAPIGLSRRRSGDTCRMCRCGTNHTSSPAIRGSGSRSPDGPEIAGGWPGSTGRLNEKLVSIWLDSRGSQGVN